MDPINHFLFHRGNTQSGWQNLMGKWQMPWKQYRELLYAWSPSNLRNEKRGRWNAHCNTKLRRTATVAWIWQTTSNKPCRCSQKQGRDGQGVVCDREYKRVGSRVSRFAAQLIIDTRGGYRIHLPPMVPGVSFARSLIPSLHVSIHQEQTKMTSIHTEDLRLPDTYP